MGPPAPGEEPITTASASTETTLPKESSSTDTLLPRIPSFPNKLTITQNDTTKVDSNKIAMDTSYSAPDSTQIASPDTTNVPDSLSAKEEKPPPDTNKTNMENSQ